MKAFIAFLVMVIGLAIAPSALAYTPPTMTAHVTDTAHKLTEIERLAIDKKLEDYRLRTTNEIAVFIPASLDGESIEDVGIATGRAWKLGVKGQDNGVLLIIAPVERKARIEVGKGVEGALTDLQSNDIIRGKIRPNLTPGHESYNAAVDSATDAIIADLDKGGAGAGPVPAKKHTPAKGGDVAFAIIFLLFMVAVPIIFVVFIIRGIMAAFSSNGRRASSGWASGGSWSNDSSWSSSSNDSSWSSGSSGGGSDWGGSSGGGGDSGFSGGGGDFGGGGSSDSF
jgi:uncharacterized protein